MSEEENLHESGEQETAKGFGLVQPDGPRGTGSQPKTSNASDQLQIQKRFSSSDYAKYFSLMENPGNLVKVQCKLKCFKQGAKEGQEVSSCGSLITLQRDTYSNLKRHLENVHKITALEPNTETSSVGLKQPTLAEFKDSNSTYPATNLKQLRFERDVLDCFALDGMPFETVDKVGFVKLVNGLDKRINVHSRTYFMGKLQKLVTDEILPLLKKDLQKVEKRFCHFSCDVWTSRTGEGILCILAHYVDNSWILQKRVLHYEPLAKRHTGDYIRGVFLKCLADFGVPSNWGGFVVSDNASNMKKAFNLENILEDDEWAHLWSKQDIFSTDADAETITADEFYDEVNDPSFLPSILQDFSNGLYDPMNDLPVQGHLACAAHTLQLAINDSIKSDAESKDFLKYINKIMVFFKRSTRWRDELKNYCKDSPKIHCVTRWNSYLDMIRRFEKDQFFAGVRNVLDRATLESGSTGTPDAPAVVFQPRARELRSILLSVAYATDKLQSDGCTANLLIPVITSAFRSLINIRPLYYPILQKAVVRNIKLRMEPIMKRKEYALATLLDPRIKSSVFNLKWTGGDSLNIFSEAEAMELLRAEFNDWSGNETNLDSDSQDLDVLSSDDDPLFSMLSEAPKANILRSEIDQYISEPRSLSTSCPLKFWESNSTRFEVLSKIARKYLAIPASSAGVERIFSISGWLSRARRASISSENISRLLMVREEVERSLSQRGLKRKNI